MICNQCGAYTKALTKYCAECGAPMPAPTEAENAKPTATQEGGERPGWDLVRSPKWPKPEFSVSTANSFLPPEPERTSPSFTHEPVANSEQNPAAYSSLFKAQQNVRQFNEEYVAPQPVYTEPRPVEPQIPFAPPIHETQAFGRAPERTAYNTDEYDEDFTFSAQPRRSPAFPEQKRGFAVKQGSVRGVRRTGSSLRGGSINPLIFAAVGGLIVLGLIIFGLYKLFSTYGGPGGFFSSVFGGSPITKPATIVEGLDENGTECYIITIYAREGNVVTARAGDDQISGDIGPSGYKMIRIPKSRFLPPEPVEQETVELKADVFLTTPDDEIVPVDVPAVTVNVPALELEIFEPAGSPAYATRAKINVSGKAGAPGAKVTLEGQELSVDDSGEFSGEYTLPGVGVHSLTIQASKNGYQVASRTIEIDYTVAEADLGLDNTTLRTPTNSNKTTVKGNLAPGSTISITPPAGVTADEPVVDAATGAFSFTVEIDSEGSYAIPCVVIKDGVSTAGEIIVERAPVLDTYSRACQQMDYTRMTTEPNHTATYVCIGKVTEVIATEPYIVAKLSTDLGDVVFEYHGTAASVEAGDGRTYNVYGDYRGIHQDTGLPLIYGWFIIKPSR